ncbi:DUF5686 and carboxypeptidase regulatory-like domain-containing protein [Massilibacteroides vaginae]|uniref:DUF5686 and carboxypeptidase regulatory-like domain-containing protein n=1 Tax=Massilibacteroides vaginae TaxID=1673718 RepID=UPI000A1CDCDA|nr:DUF5686 and carboxypeptidase regulatory-like domain-containing protein [Massilibacteroides vaginae]
MRRLLLTVGWTVFWGLSLFAQIFSGRIADQSGEAILGSTVFIRETTQGIVCNDEGEFRISLKEGRYTAEFRSLGYETQVMSVVMETDRNVVVDVKLADRSYALSEVVVTGQEDPAYEIMRQAIAKAPFHANQVKSYHSEVYQKLKLKLLALPKIPGVKLETNEGLNLNDYKGNLFMQESFNEINYISPDKYEQIVKGFSSTIPDNLNPEDAFRITKSSLYQPTFAGLTSPLHPKAFSYYKFRYEGFIEEDGQVVNKIKIIPKLNDPLFVSGYIYIADNEWNIRFAELTLNILGSLEVYRITYNEVADSVYLPTTYDIDSKISLMGFKAEGSYSSSTKYTEVIPNDSVMVVLEKKKKPKRSLEISKDTTYVVKSDSLANKKDSLFWKEIRTLPLTDDELLSYQKKDSIQAFTDSIKQNYHNTKFKPKTLLTGGKVGGDSARISLKYGGLLRALPEYNFVDGYWLGQRFDLGIHIGKHNSFHVVPAVYYATARKRVLWETALQLNYAPLRFGFLELSAGSTSVDYNPDGALRIENALNSFLWGSNRSMLYQNDYFHVKHKIEPIHALQLTIEVDIAKRRSLENNVTDMLFGKKTDVTPNLITDSRFDRIRYDVDLEYTFNQYYELYKGRKIYKRTNSPTVNLHYSRNTPVNDTQNSSSQSLEMGVRQTIKTGLFSSFLYSLNAGTFLGSYNRMNFADYKHFNTSDLMFTGKNSFDSYMLLDYYTHSTNEHWVQANMNYNSQYIFLKRLPFLQGKVFGETLGAKYLYTPHRKHYTEFGYSVGFGKLMNVGVFGSFNDFKQDKFGVRFTLDISDL